MYFYVNLIFIIITLWYAFCGEKHIKEEQRRYCLIFLIIIYSVIMAYRPEYTPDTLGYISGFNSTEAGHFFSGSILQKYGGYELGYIYLIKIFKLFSESYRLFFFILALLGIVCTLIGLTNIYARIEGHKDGKALSQIFALYVACYGVLYNGISLRAGVAIGFGVIFIDLMLKKKYLYGSLFILLAILIHRSAFLFIIAYIAIRFLPIIPKKIHVLIWIIIGVLLFVGVGQIISQPINEALISLFNKFNITSVHYLTNIDDKVGMTDVLMWLIYGFFIICDIKNEYYYRCLNVIMVGAFIVLTMYGVTAISRAWDLFYIMMIPMTRTLCYHKSDLLSSIMLQRFFVILLIIVRAYKMLSAVF